MDTKDKKFEKLKKFFLKHYIKYIIFAVLLTAIVVSIGFSNYIDRLVVSHLEKRNILTKQDKLLVHVLSVGEADACVINLPNGKVCVIDTGTIYSSYQLVSYINDNAINNNKSKKIDYLFYTHADDDHSGGVEALVANFEVLNIVRPRQYSKFENIRDDYGEIVDTDNYLKTMTAIYNECKVGANLIKAEDGLKIEVGQVIFEIFYPLKKYEDSNNYSYYIKLTYKNKSMLFTGDALIESEKDLVKIHKEELNSDILKVGHHGGDNSNSLEFLEAISPKYAVISVGPNRLGHPHETVLDSLKNLECSIYRTDEVGTFIIDIGKEIKFYIGNYSFASIKFSYQIFSIICIFVILLLVLIDALIFIIRDCIIEKQSKKSKENA